ncbi:MAG: DNA topoisomerase VI subunit B [Phycisphaerae bacterium]|nr:DNA topoisomerase VI subunit B [Phycisphaerae bacterium]
MPDSATLEAPQPTERSRRAPRVTAETMATKQREISVSEFFAKNRHLLGFDNPRKALLTTVKEAVDNSLDACEEAGILPDILVEIRLVSEPQAPSRKPQAESETAGRKAQADERFRVIVQDNGPGIVRKQIENIFGKLLYGSKFHRLKMSRGQQGIGISAAGMYGLITTGKPVLIISKSHPKKPAQEVVLKMDTSKNRADVVSETEHPEDDSLFPDGTGTRVEIELAGKYFTGARSVDEYVELTAIANPHTRFTYVTPPTSQFPEGRRQVFERSVDELPVQPEEIKPHPHGIELGTLIGMLERTEHGTLSAFFTEEFCRVGPSVAKAICESVGLSTRYSTKKVSHGEAEKLYKALQEAKVMAPPTNCLSPIGVKTMLKGLERGLKPNFIAVSSRPPAVYRGRPFIIEAGIAFGGDLPAEEPAQVFRFANRVPLLYQQSACSSFKAVSETNWKNYGMQQPKGSLPVGPMVVMLHMASVWVPFTSESKEAIADYDEIREEMELALKDCGRKLKTYLNRRDRMKAAGERRSIFLRYIGEIAKAVSEINGQDAQALYDALMKTAQRKTLEMDQTLDEEGKVINAAEKLEADEAVYVKPLDEHDLIAIAEEKEAARQGAKAGGQPTAAVKSSLLAAGQGISSREPSAAPPPGKRKRKATRPERAEERKPRPSAKSERQRPPSLFENLPPPPKPAPGKHVVLVRKKVKKKPT